MATTLEWFGATTFRLRTNDLTIFLDTWLERPSCLPQYLSIEEVDQADYIFISHAHFDHLPGADRIAIKTGAVVIANSEAINALREAGVPEGQLVPVAGGERIPLFTKAQRDGASASTLQRAPGPPFAPSQPHPSLAAMAVHVWPSLHCLLPGLSHDAVPDVLDTADEFTGSASPYACTLDITTGMKHGLLRVGELIPESKMDEKMKSFAAYVADRKKHVFSHCDGGQLSYNFLIGPSKTLFWNGHLGGYSPILEEISPKPDVAILAIAGRANLNGRPFDGSAAQFARNQVRWLGEPGTVIWCLHDAAPLKPFSINTAAATMLVEEETSSKVLELTHAIPTVLFE